MAIFIYAEEPRLTNFFKYILFTIAATFKEIPQLAETDHRYEKVYEYTYTMM